MKKKFLLISNLASNSKAKTYTGGKPWKEFRREIENNLKNLTRFIPQEIEWKTVFAENYTLLQWEKLEKEITTYHGIIISGSPYSVYEDLQWIHNEKKFLQRLLKTEACPPIVGVCFGHQIIAEVLEGMVQKHEEYFQGNVAFIAKDKEYVSYANHGDYVSLVPTGAKVIAHGPHNMPYIVQYKKKVYGIQCHLEREVDCPISNEFWKEFLESVF